MEKKILAGVVALSLVLSFVALSRSGEQGPAGKDGRDGSSVGASAGPRHTTRNYFNEGLTVGDRVATTTGVSAYTTANSDFRQGQTYWDVTPNLNTTLTINATSTFPFVPQVGNTAKLYLRNASSTATATITLAAENASVDLQFVEATGGDLVLNGLDYSELTLIRESANLVSILVNEFTEAD